MSHKEKKPVVVRRYQAALILLTALMFLGLLAYKKVQAAEATAVEKYGDTMPVSEVLPEKPDDVKDPGTLDKLKSWVSAKKKQVFGDEGDIPMGSSGKSSVQSVSSSKAKELKEIFESNSSEIDKEVTERAAVDSKQLDCVVKALFFEAGGEPDLGIQWVYDVIKNRTDIEYRGNTTMCETIFDHKQFSFANINPDRVPKYTADLKKVTSIAEEFYFDKDHKDKTCGSTHYLKKDIMWDVKWSRQALQRNSDEGLVLKAIIGKHAFFGQEGCYDED